MPQEKKWCFSWYAAAPPTTGATKAALVKGSKWQSGDTISFLSRTARKSRRLWSANLRRAGSMDWPI